MLFNKALKDHCKGAYKPASLVLKKGYVLGVPMSDSEYSKEANKVYRGKRKGK